MRGLSTPSDLSDVLVEQFSMIERVLALNKQMAERLKHMGQPLSFSQPSQIDDDEAQAPKTVDRAVAICADSVKIHHGSKVHLHGGGIADLLVPLIPETPPGNDSTRISSKASCAATAPPRQKIQEVAKRGSDVRLEAMFHDTDDLKKSVYEALLATRYNVEDLYSQNGFWQGLARSPYLKNSALLVIMINTIYIGIEADLNHAAVLPEAPFFFQIMDNFFCVFYFFEVLVRLMAFKETWRAFYDGWFVFDMCLVTLMAWDTWVLSFAYLAFEVKPGDAGTEARYTAILRVFRLVRVFRVSRASRILCQFPELLVLIRGLVVGARSVFAVVCMLMLVIYVFALIFTMTLGNRWAAGGSFDGVITSMYTLIVTVIAGPDTDLMAQLLAIHWIYFFVFVMFVIVTSFTIMNMLIGILCDAVSSATSAAQDEHFAEVVAYEIDRLTQIIDRNGDGMISKEDFEYIIHDAEIADTMDSLGVDIVGVADFARYIFEQSSEMSSKAFAQMVGHFRGNRNASVKDITELRRYVSMELIHLESRLGTEKEMEGEVFVEPNPSSKVAFEFGFGHI